MNSPYEVQSYYIHLPENLQQADPSVLTENGFSGDSVSLTFAYKTRLT